MKPLILRRGWDLLSRRFPALAYDVNYWRRYRRWEPDLWEIPRFCRRDRGAVDVGANMGIFSRYIARHAAVVDSFECNPNLAPDLARVLPHNVRLHACALSSAPGEAQLRFDPANTGVGTIEAANRLDNNPGIRTVTAIDVQVRRLDDFALQPVSFMKIDVEGHELEVLRGARGLLERDLPAILIEIEERHCPGNLSAVPGWLAELGYQPKVLDGARGLVPAPELTTWAARGWNNFWFVAR